MPFIHPAIFWIGLAAASAPVLIHLLNRRRYRVRDWAAMRFVEEAFRRQRRRLQVEQLILLLLRVMAVLLLGVSLARFVGCGSPAILPGASGERTTVFVLDDSVSTGQRFGGAMAFDLAATDLAEQLNALGDAEKIAIRRTSDSVDAPLFGVGFATDRASLIARIKSAEPSDLAGDWLKTLAAAATDLADQPGERRLVIFADARAADLPPGRTAAMAKILAPLAAAGVDITVMDYAQPPQDNLTLASLEMADPFIVAGAPARVTAVVTNHSPDTAGDVELQIAMRLLPPGADEPVDVELPAAPVDTVEPGGRRRVEFEVTIPQAGTAVVRASLPADELPGDNAAYLELNVHAQLRILLVDGRPNAADPTDSESFTFAAAVDPSGHGAGGVRVDIIGPQDVASVALDDYDAVALLAVPDLPGEIDPEGRTIYPQLAVLEDYVRGGGGLLIATGPDVNLMFYNGPLLADGRGLSPFRIGPTVGGNDRRGEFVRLAADSIDATHPAVQTFAGDGTVLAEFIRFFAFTPAEEIAEPGLPTDDADSAAAPPHVLARFTDNDRSPAIVSRGVGDGRVVMVYTTLSTRWNDWADDEPPGIYVAPIQDLIRYLVRRRNDAASPLVGTRIAHRSDDDFRDAEITLRKPSFPTSDLVVLRSGGRLGAETVAFDDPAEAGIYTLTLARPDGRKRSVLIARNIDPAEGRLTRAGQARVAAAVGTERFTYIARTGQASLTVHAPARSEWWLWLLLAAVALLAAETYLARRFGHYTTTESAGGTPS